MIVEQERQERVNRLRFELDEIEKDSEKLDPVLVFLMIVSGVLFVGVLYFVASSIFILTRQ